MTGAVLAALMAAAAPAAPSPPSWEFGFTGALYLQSGEDDFLQPTLRADHGRLHLESRYNYEALRSASFFAGARFEIGQKVKLALTPLIGGLVGETDGIVPALQVDLTVWRLEAYSEAEYVFGLGADSSSYLYTWSELSLAPAEGLRAGVVTQVTRVQREANDFQAGLLVGFTYKRLDGTAYLFQPGGDDQSLVLSLGVSF